MNNSHVAGQLPAKLETTASDRQTSRKVTGNLDDGSLSNGPSWKALLQIGHFLAQSDSDFTDTLQNSNCTTAELATKSPVKIPSARLRQSRMVLNLFEKHEVFWAGTQPGRLDLVGRYSMREQFLAEASRLQFVQPSVISHPVEWWHEPSAEHGLPLLRRKFFVVGTPDEWLFREDGKDSTATLINWLKVEFGMKLRAAVMSQHALEGWFAPPAEVAQNALALLLPALNVAEAGQFDLGHAAMLPSEAAQLVYLTK